MNVSDVTYHEDQLDHDVNDVVTSSTDDDANRVDVTAAVDNGVSLAVVDDMDESRDKECSLAVDEDGHSSSCDSLNECLADRSASLSTLSSNGGDEDDFNRILPVDTSSLDVAAAGGYYALDSLTVTNIGGGPSSPSSPSSRPLEPIVVGRQRSVQTFDRVKLSEPIWHPPVLNHLSALHILHNREPGTFLVLDGSTGALLLYVREATGAPTKVNKYTVIYEQGQGYRLTNDTQRQFHSLHALITYYCENVDIGTRPRLVLPQAIEEAKTQKDLHSIALLEHQFWTPAHVALRMGHPKYLKSISSTSPKPTSPTSPNGLSPTTIHPQTASHRQSSTLSHQNSKPDLAVLYSLPGRKSDDAANRFTTDTEDDGLAPDFLASCSDSDTDAGLAKSSTWTYTKAADNSSNLVGLTFDSVAATRTSFSSRSNGNKFPETNGDNNATSFNSQPRSNATDLLATQCLSPSRNFSVENQPYNSLPIKPRRDSAVSESLSTSASTCCLDPTKYQLKGTNTGVVRENKLVAVSTERSSQEYTFKCSSKNLLSPFGAASTAIGASTTTANRSPVVQYENVEACRYADCFSQPGNLKQSVDISSGRNREIFTFNVTADSQIIPLTGSHEINPSSNDANFQPSPIYALPYDALIDKVEKVSDSVNAMRAAAAASGVPLMRRTSMTNPSGNVGAQKRSTAVHRSESDRARRVASAAVDVGSTLPVAQPLYSSFSVAGRPKPQLTPLFSDYTVPHDVSPSPKLRTASRSQSMWTFTVDRATGRSTTNLQVPVASSPSSTPSRVSCFNLLPNRPNVNTDTMKSSTQAATVNSKNIGSNNQNQAVSANGGMNTANMEFRKVNNNQFYNTPSAAGANRNSYTASTLNTPHKFPVSGTDNPQSSAQTRIKTVDDIIANLTPELRLRPIASPLASNSSNRISMYDNVGNRTAPVRRSVAANRESAISSSTCYAQPWDDWETLTGYVPSPNTKDAEKLSTGVEIRNGTVQPPLESTRVSSSKSGNRGITLTEIDTSNKNHHSYESKSLTRGSTARSIGAVEQMTPTKYMTTGRRKTTKPPIDQLDSLPGISNENLNYAEAESECPETEYFGTDINYQYDETLTDARTSTHNNLLGSSFPLEDERNFAFTFSQLKGPDVIPLIGGSQISFDRSSGSHLPGARICSYIVGQRSIATPALSGTLVRRALGSAIESTKSDLGRALISLLLLCLHVGLIKSSVSHTGELAEAYVKSLSQPPGQMAAAMLASTKFRKAEMRQFMDGMKNYLIHQSENGLGGCIKTEQSLMGPSEFLNMDTIIERALLKCVVKPLHDFICKLFIETRKSNGSLQQLYDGIKMARSRSLADLGISPDLILRHETSIETARYFLTTIKQSYSPLKKLQCILGAVSAIETSNSNINSSLFVVRGKTSKGCTKWEYTIETYEFDVLAILAYVLIRHELVTAEIEVDYTLGLVHRNFLTGHGRYCVAMFTGAINIIKVLNRSTNCTNILSNRHCIDAGFLQVVVPNEQQDKVSRYLVPVHSSMMTRDVCSLMVYRLKITNPQDHGLYALMTGSEERLNEDANPHVINTKAILDLRDCVFVYRRHNATFVWPRNL